jgi:hypothetical protein
MSRADLEQALQRLDAPIKACTSVLHANGVCHTLLVPWCNRHLEWRVRASFATCVCVVCAGTTLDEVAVRKHAR